MQPNSRPESRSDVTEAPVTSKVDGFDEGFEEDEEGGGTVLESMRVTYDDNEEKRKLMNLLAPKPANTKGAGKTAAKAATRKSTRKSGGRGASS